jgi:hypothetical protein
MKFALIPKELDKCRLRGVLVAKSENNNCLIHLMDELMNLLRVYQQVIAINEDVMGECYKVIQAKKRVRGEGARDADQVE